MNKADDLFQELKEKYKFEAIAFCGSSGCAVGFILGYMNNIPMIYVRKDNENSHGARIECNADLLLKKFLIVDDFVLSGNTVRYIAETLIKHSRENGGYPCSPCAILSFDPSQGTKKTITINGKRIKIYKVPENEN
jgi:orotate phosphoribosyltransferase